MIVCHCNAFSDHDVRRACLKEDGEGPRTVGEVYRCLGCGPKCGRCMSAVHEIMKTSLAAAQASCGEHCPIAACPHHEAHPAAVDSPLASGLSLSSLE